MGTSKTAALMTIPVAFGNVNIGDQIARLAVSIDRKRMSLAQADKLCGKRLSGRITAIPGNDNEDQEQLPGMDAETSLNGVFDVKSFGFSPKNMTTGLSFAISSIDLRTLCTFAKRAGSLVVEEIGDIPEDEGRDE